jgi:hypothetical protein
VGLFVQDPVTGTMMTEFETPSLPKYRVGGNPSDDPVASKLFSFNQQLISGYY